MIDRFKPKSEFSRNVLTLMTGTTIAQAIPIAISPILTRIYTPADFGVFALYMAIVSIVSIVATGRYELAIILPKKDEDAFNIVMLSTLISLGMSFIAFLICFVFNEQISAYFKNSEVSSWLYLIPIAILFSGLYQSLNYWNNRKKNYKELALNRVTYSASSGLLNIGMGMLKFGSNGLIYSGLVARAFVIALFVKKTIQEDKEKFYKLNRIKMLAIAKRYKQFPKFDVLASLINVSSNQLIPIFFNLFFSASVAGYYYMTQRILALPITLISSSISDVFRQEASSEYKKYANAKMIYISTFKKLLFLSLVPFIVLYIYAIDIFVIVFGESWYIAGEYVQILLPMFFIKFISSPLSFMLYIVEKQVINIYMQLLFMLAIIVSFTLFDDTNNVLYSVSFLFSLIYIFYLYISAKYAKVF